MITRYIQKREIFNYELKNFIEQVGEQRLVIQLCDTLNTVIHVGEQSPYDTVM